VPRPSEVKGPYLSRKKTTASSHSSLQCSFFKFRISTFIHKPEDNDVPGTSFSTLSTLSFNTQRLQPEQSLP
jgi:hypothetical protein